MRAILFWLLPLNTLGNDIHWLVQHSKNKLTFAQVIDSFPNHIHLNVWSLQLIWSLQSSQNIVIIAVVSGLVAGDPVLLALKADKK